MDYKTQIVQSLKRATSMVRHGGGFPSFSYHTTRGALVIIDLNRGGPSVTNRAKEVLTYIYKQSPELASFPIVYKDSSGKFDAMELIDGQYIGFKILHADTEDQAIDRLAEQTV